MVQKVFKPLRFYLIYIYILFSACSCQTTTEAEGGSSSAGEGSKSWRKTIIYYKLELLIKPAGSGYRVVYFFCTSSRVNSNVYIKLYTMETDGWMQFNALILNVEKEINHKLSIQTPRF